MLRSIIKSNNDARIYKSVWLSNQLNCLLISDKTTDKSAASLNVHVGQASDPVERPGLAHFLEHMLFLGTEKYPNQNDYSSYITSNSGSNNAYTAMCNTNYFFDCSNNAFHGALDRFAQFFITPLFTESCTDREINAVQSEHEKNLMSDMWRQMQLFRNSSHQGHAYNKFGTGNKDTLHHEGTRNDLLSFYKNYYSSNIMKLVLYGKEDVDTLENWAQNMFSAVPNFNIEVPTFKEPAFTKENLGSFWKITPIKDKDQLDFVWILDNLAQHYKNHPASYISHLIGNEGPNSLLSYLIDEGLATELHSGYNTEMSLFTKVSISIQLTKKGMQNHERVCKIVFEYLKMLRHKGAEQRIFEEIQKILKVAFHFKDKEQPMNYVMALADRMQYYPTEDILRLNYLMEDFNPELINKVINSLTLDNMRVYLISKSVEKDCNQTEKWYGTKYNSEPFSQKFREMFDNPHIGPSRTGKILDLPPPNLFIPEHFDLYAKDFTSLPKYPLKIHETEKMEVFHKQDNTFKQPKASMYVKIYSNDLGFGSNSKTFLLLDFWVKLFNESIREMLDQAGAASVGVAVSLDAEGTEVVISGFNDSLLKVSAVLFDRMRTFNPMVLKEQYESIYESAVKNVKNFYRNQPYQQGMTFQNANMQKSSENFLPEEELHLLSELTFKDLLDFHASWFKTIRLESLFIGNITKEMSIEISTNIENILSSMRESTFTLSKDDTPEVRVIRLGQEKIWFYEHENFAQEQERQESNSALISLFQYEQETPFTRVLMSILGNYLREPCFDRLRTDEQLGYIVSGFNANMRGVLNYVILVQSNIKSPQYLSQRVLAFLDSMREKIKLLTQEEFEKYVESIRVKISQKDLSIRQEGSKYWHEITTHKYVFDRREKDLEVLNKIKKEDLLWIFEEVFFKNRKLFETHVISQNHKEENNTLKAERLKTEKDTSQVKSAAWFKRRLPLYPDFNSML